MKLLFKHQNYQTDAAMSVVRCFKGQGKGFGKEVIDRTRLFTEEIFSNKKLEIDKNEILKNVRVLQKEQGLKTISNPEGLNFTIEMETGTGKTYVYTKTMHELNEEYGWNKFIIMVPSVAIREGVHKSFEITAGHFQEIYGKKIRFSIYNTKNRSNLINIKNLQIPLPPLDIQEQIIAEIEKKQKMVDECKKLIIIHEQKIKTKIAEVWGEE